MQRASTCLAMVRLDSLAPFVRRPAEPRTSRCELCAGPLDERHRHVLERSSRTLRCSCTACGVLFSDGAGGRYLTVPGRVLVDPEFRAEPADWATFGIPVSPAFIVAEAAGGPRTARFP